MKTCSKDCGAMATIVDADHFCYVCGAPLREIAACACGRELGSANKFCPRCGKAVER